MDERHQAGCCRLAISYEECLACAACTAVCHSLALNMAALMLELTAPLCDNCSLCIYVCPTGALSLRDRVSNE